MFNMFKRILVIGLIYALAVYALSATFGQAHASTEGPVKVSLMEWMVDMPPTTVQVGTPVRFVIANTGKVQHEFVIEKAGDVDKALEAEVNGQPVTAETDNIDPGTTRTLEWTFTEPGTYQVSCHMPGHFEAGMKTVFNVIPAPASGANGAAPANLPMGGLDATIAVLVAAAGAVVLLGSFGARKLLKR
jgi:uncharacterized cupredoxin-like copper-binding protein